MTEVISGRQVKDLLYEQFARIGKAVANARRIEILDLLCQGERSVETLARAAGMQIANTSAHLQVLRQARLVETRREGTKVFYRLSDDEVCQFYFSLRDLAGARLAEVELIVREYFDDPSQLEPISRAELIERMDEGRVVVIDVRPAEEYAAGHIPGAVSVPYPDLDDHIDELPADVEVVAYCRGPYCVLAPAALSLLGRRGLRARRLREGFPEWRAAGLPVAQGSGP